MNIHKSSSSGPQLPGTGYFNTVDVPPRLFGPFPSVISHEICGATTTAAESGRGTFYELGIGLLDFATRVDSAKETAKMKEKKNPVEDEQLLIMALKYSFEIGTS